jgi:hypothetical protein
LTPNVRQEIGKKKVTDTLDELAFDANMIQRKWECEKQMDKLKKNDGIDRI